MVDDLLRIGVNGLITGIACCVAVRHALEPDRFAGIVVVRDNQLYPSTPQRSGLQAANTDVVIRDTTARVMTGRGLGCLLPAPPRSESWPMAHLLVDASNIFADQPEPEEEHPDQEKR
jgi:hypothetical protein